jgi:hypothetical protein
MNVSRRLIGPYLGARLLSRNIHRSNIHRMAAAAASTRGSAEPDSPSQLRKALEDSARPKDDLASIARELPRQLKLRNEQKNEGQEQKTSSELVDELLRYLDPRQYLLAMNPLSALFNNDPRSFVLLDDVKKKALHVRPETFISLAAKAALWDKDNGYYVYVMKGNG